METAAGIWQQGCSCGSASFRCWCLDCNEALCDVCLSAHRRVTVTRSHRILNQPPAGDVSTPPIKFCRLHPSEPLKLYCFTCDELTCRDCQLAAHMNHRYQFVKEALATVKQQLQDRVRPITEQRDTMRRSLSDMKIRLQDITDSRSNLRSELQLSLKFITDHLKKRMEEILMKAEEVGLLEFERIKMKMTKMMQLRQNQLLVTEIIEKARNTNDLSLLRSYAAQVEGQLKDSPGLDLSPPQVMSHLKVVTNKTSLEAVLRFGELEVLWIPFSVSQSTNQKPPNAAASSASSSSSSSSSSSPPTLAVPLPPSKPLPQTRPTLDSPVAVSCSATSSKSSSSMLRLAPSSSSTVISTTSTCLSPPCGSLPQDTCNKDSPVPVNCPSTSWKFPSNRLSHPLSSVSQSQTSLTTTAPVTSTPAARYPSTTCPRLLFLLKDSSVNLQPVSVHRPPSSDPSPVLKPVQPSLALIKPTAPQNQNQSTTALLNNTQTTSCYTLFSVMPQFPMMLSPTLPGNTLRKHQKNLMRTIRPETRPATTNGKRNPDSGGLRGTAPRQPLKVFGFTSTSSPLSSDQRLTSDIGLHSSSLKDQQSPVVRAVADSACDRSVQPVAARRPEPAENEPTSTVSEEPAPAAEPYVLYRKAEEPEPEVSDTEAEQCSVIGHLDCSLSQWQPRVSLFRLPVTPPHLGRPDPCFGPITGDPEEELYLKQIREDTQARPGEVTDDVITELPSSPESPVTLVTVTCSACQSANSSIVCSFCGRGYHRDCHDPPVGPDIRSEWICSLCQDPVDPSDPFSSDRPPRPKPPCLSLQDQRRCERLLLYLKVEGCTRLPQAQLTLMSERLSLRRSPSYETASEFLCDTWSLFEDASQDNEILNRLQENLRSRLASDLMSPSSRNTDGGKPTAGQTLNSNVSDGLQVAEGSTGSKVNSEEQEGTVTRESKVKATRKRLRNLLDWIEASRSKRSKTDETPPGDSGN